MRWSSPSSSCPSTASSATCSSTDGWQRAWACSPTTFSIEEASKEVEPEVKEETPAPPKIENNTPSKNEKEETKPQQNTTIPSQKPSPKYFLFEDGYTINNVVDACAKELKSYGGSGRCEPITNENGIYLGMKLLYE